MGGQGHGVILRGPGEDRCVQPKHGVLPGENGAHVAGAACQHLTGGSVGQGQGQLSLRLLARKAEHKPQRVQGLLGGEGLTYGFFNGVSIGGVLVVQFDRDALGLGRQNLHPPQHQGGHQQAQGQRRAAQASPMGCKKLFHSVSPYDWQ